MSTSILYVSNTKDIEQKLLRAELDVGIVEGGILSDLTVLPIIDDCLVLAVGKYHPLYHRNCIQIRDACRRRLCNARAGERNPAAF